MEKIEYDFTILEMPSKEELANLDNEKTSSKTETMSRNQPSDQQLFPKVDRSTKPKLSSTHPSSTGKPVANDSEILSVCNKLDTLKLEKVNNTEVPSGGQNGTTGSSVSSPSLKTPQRPDPSSKPPVMVTATGGATIAAQEVEFRDFEVRNKKVIEEHEARLAQVRAEEEKIARLQKVKQDEAKATADLMRKKRSIEDDIHKLKEEEARR